jgi:hypothetical protein
MAKIKATQMTAAAMTKGGKVPVSERALFSRINRALAKQGESLRRCREDSRSFSDLGAYYIIDIRGNYVTAKFLELDKLGRKMGVLEPYEALDDR